MKPLINEAFDELQDLNQTRGRPTRLRPTSPPIPLITSTTIKAHSRSESKDLPLLNVNTSNLNGRPDSSQGTRKSKKSTRSPNLITRSNATPPPPSSAAPAPPPSALPSPSPQPHSVTTEEFPFSLSRNVSKLSGRTASSPHRHQKKGPTSLKVKVKSPLTDECIIIKVPQLDSAEAMNEGVYVDRVVDAIHDQNGPATSSASSLSLSRQIKGTVSSETVFIEGNTTSSNLDASKYPTTRQNHGGALASEPNPYMDLAYTLYRWEFIYSKVLEIIHGVGTGYSSVSFPVNQCISAFLAVALLRSLEVSLLGKDTVPSNTAWMSKIGGVAEEFLLFSTPGTRGFTRIRVWQRPMSRLFLKGMAMACACVAFVAGLVMTPVDFNLYASVSTGGGSYGTGSGWVDTIGALNQPILLQDLRSWTAWNTVRALFALAGWVICTWVCGMEELRRQGDMFAPQMASNHHHHHHGHHYDHPTPLRKKGILPPIASSS